MSESAISLPDGVGEDFERFVVHDRLEIVSILRKLQQRRATITLSWGSADFALTTLLAVNPEFEEMVFDCGNDPRANRSLMQSDRVTMVAIVDGIRLQFHARHTDPTIFEGHPALRMRLPELVLRLQRRDSFRVAASLTCQIALDSDGAVKVLELRVADLSLGGVALVSVKNHVELECGQVLENCRIDLGTHGTLAVSLVVKNLSENITRNKLRQQRIGCSFAIVTREMETAISRYIGRAERERRTRD